MIRKIWNSETVKEREKRKKKKYHMKEKYSKNRLKKYIYIQFGTPQTKTNLKHNKNSK